MDNIDSGFFEIYTSSIIEGGDNVINLLLMTEKTEELLIMAILCFSMWFMIFLSTIIIKLIGNGKK